MTQFKCLHSPVALILLFRIKISTGSCTFSDPICTNPSSPCTILQRRTNLKPSIELGTQTVIHVTLHTICWCLDMQIIDYIACVKTWLYSLHRRYIGMHPSMPTAYRNCNSICLTASWVCCRPGTLAYLLASYQGCSAVRKPRIR